MTTKEEKFREAMKEEFREAMKEAMKAGWELGFDACIDLVELLGNEWGGEFTDVAPALKRMRNDVISRSTATIR